MTAALILAGGTGSRLGGVDKAFLRLDGQTLIAHLLDRLEPQVRNIAISANGDPVRFTEFGLPVLPDPAEFVGKGPLAGLAAGLAWALSQNAASLLTIPVDTPFIPENLLSRLSPAPAVAVWQRRQHHLVTLWPTSILPLLDDFLTRPGAYKVRDFLTLCGALQVAFDAPQDPFLNINTAEDWVAAKTCFRNRI